MCVCVCVCVYVCVCSAPGVIPPPLQLRGPNSSQFAFSLTFCIKSNEVVSLAFYFLFGAIFLNTLPAFQAVEIAIHRLPSSKYTLHTFCWGINVTDDSRLLRNQFIYLTYPFFFPLKHPVLVSDVKWW